MKWLVHNYGELANNSGWLVEVEAESREEAIQNAPYDWKDPERRYYGATLKPTKMEETEA